MWTCSLDKTPEPQFLADPNDGSYPLAQCSFQNLIAIFGNPDDVVAMVKNGSSLSSSEDEGLDPKKETINNNKEAAGFWTDNNANTHGFLVIITPKSRSLTFVEVGPNNFSCRCHSGYRDQERDQQQEPNLRLLDG